MSNHLSQDQFAHCIVGRPTSAELQHVAQCPECSAELERFGNTFSLFRSAIRERINDRVALHPPRATPLRPAQVSRWRWASGAAAVVVLVMVSFFMSENEPQEVREQAATRPNPDAIMDAVNRHLSRIVPAPMEPMMSLLPNDESINESGEVQ